MALEASDLTQQDMAELVESHRTTLTRWMHDEIVPKRLYLKIWADATGVDFSWFEEVYPASEPPAASPIKAEKPAHKSRRRRTSTRWDAECNEDASLRWEELHDDIRRFVADFWTDPLDVVATS